MLYFVLLLISFLNTALAARPKCSPQYSAIANYINDYEPAVAWCSRKIAGRTSTVTVTQTIRRQQKREAAPTSAPDDAVPANLFAYAASHSKPRPNNDDAGQLARPHAKAPRQYNANWANYYYNMMQSQSQGSSPWVRAVCSCVVTPRVVTVTRTSTTTVAGYSPLPTTSSTRPLSSLPSSTRPSSAYEIPNSVRSSTSWTASTGRSSSSTSVHPYFPSTSVCPSSAYEIPNSGRSSTTSAASTARSSSSSSSAASVYPHLSSTSTRLPTTSNPPPGPPTANSASAYLPPAPPSSSASASVLPAGPLADKNCTAGTYQGTGACACEYTVVCGYAGNCGAASEAVTSSAATWQQCAQTCDDNSACSAWTYSVTSAACTEVVDPNCDMSGFVSIAAGDGVLGVYAGGCVGVCLI
ncbi:hypothetical protein B0J12DRAFT_741544 [Macrophomina phaseolina]|uniref:Apple domain-containing protein n=1 Tax=Macrophomina phaseolina TaxID=35725 RepID=A0ABQ8G6J1_9PEZI|nr:hypothetical protein B0J12DRAFT_741544 [Macrophomina phaseolina]